MKTKANPKSKSPNGNPKIALKSNPKMIPQSEPQSEALHYKHQNEDAKSTPKMMPQSETLKWNAQAKYMLRCGGGACKQTETKKK